MRKTFRELDEVPTPAMIDLKDTFADYADAGRAISSHVVIRLISKTNPSMGDKHELRETAIRGKSRQEKDTHSSDAEQYQAVADYLSR